MDNERRKRKIENDEEDEEEKMEKFYALIRSSRDVRDRTMSSAERSKEGEKKKAVEEGERPKGGVWNPSFQPEDFMELFDKSKGPHHSIPALEGPSKRSPDDENQEDDKDEGKGGSDGLDLNLSL